MGGVAAIAHGMSHTTNDIDICYERSAKNIQALVRALKPSNPRLRIPGGTQSFLFDEKTIRNGMNFTLETAWGLIDLLGELPILGAYKDLIGNAIPMDFYGKKVNILSLDDLIKSKKSSGRVKDKLHLMELEAIREITKGN